MLVVPLVGVGTVIHLERNIINSRWPNDKGEQQSIFPSAHATNHSRGRTPTAGGFGVSKVEISVPHSDDKLHSTQKHWPKAQEEAGNINLKTPGR